MNRFWSRALLAVAIFATAASCMKKPNLTEEDGDPIDPSVVQSKVVSAWGNDTYSDIKVGEFTATDVSITLAELPPYVTMQDSKEVTRVADSSDGLSNIFNIRHHVVEDASGSQKPFDEEFQIGPYLKPEYSTKSLPSPLKAESSNDVSIKADTPSTPFSLQFLTMLFQICGAKDVTCHNLETWQETTSPPPAVANRTGCEGLRDCKMKVNGIAFDYITQVHDDEANTNVRLKQRISAKMSPDVPVLSRVTEFCIAGVEIRNGSMYNSTTCYNVSNFKRGTSP